MTDENLSNTFNLVLLGTDTPIEKEGATTRGYERGESLNAIYHRLKGTPYQDKHIVSGAVTNGADTDKKAAEAIWMVLKAISEGKTTIKIAGHSRGGVEGVLVAHALETMLSRLMHADAKTIMRVIKGMPLGYVDHAVKRTVSKKNKQLVFTLPGQNEQTIDIVNLLKQIKKQQINCELFLIDPVPGQSKVKNWVMKQFFEIPKIVKKAKLVYMNDERTMYFEPIVPNKFPNQCDVEILPLPGHHGTATGWLNEQAIIASNLIDVDRDENGHSRGKKTRHVQKLVAAKLVDFFNPESFVNADDVAKPSIEKTINRYVMRPQDKVNQYKLRLYNKIWERRKEYQKFQSTGYQVKLKRNLLVGKKRQILTGVNTGRIYQNNHMMTFNEHRQLQLPLLNFVNNEHIHLFVNGHDEFKTSPVFAILKLAKKFNEIVKYEKEIKRLYANESTAEMYQANFYMAVSGFLGDKIDALLNGEAVKHDIARLVAAVKELQKNMIKYEIKNNPMVSVANVLTDTWHSIVAANIIPTIHEINQEAKKISKPVNLEQLNGLVDRVEKYKKGLLQMKEVGLISQNECLSHLADCECLCQATVLMAQADTFDQAANLLNYLDVELTKQMNRLHLGSVKKMSAVSQQQTLIRILDDEISDVADVPFRRALRRLRHKMTAKLDKRISTDRVHLQDKTACQIAKHTINMLRQLRDPKADKAAVLREYEKHCKQTSGWRKFFDVIKAVCVAALVLVTGAAVCVAVAPFPAVAFATVPFAVAAGVGSGVWFFKPKGLRKQAVVVAAVGRKTFGVGDR